MENTELSRAEHDEEEVALRIIEYEEKMPNRAVDFDPFYTDWELFILYISNHPYIIGTITCGVVAIIIYNRKSIVKVLRQWWTAFGEFWESRSLLERIIAIVIVICYDLKVICP